MGAGAWVIGRAIRACLCQGFLVDLSISAAVVSVVGRLFVDTNRELRRTDFYGAFGFETAHLV